MFRPLLRHDPRQEIRFPPCQASPLPDILSDQQHQRWGGKGSLNGLKLDGMTLAAFGAVTALLWSRIQAETKSDTKAAAAERRG